MLKYLILLTAAAWHCSNAGHDSNSTVADSLSGTIAAKITSVVPLAASFPAQAKVSYGSSNYFVYFQNNRLYLIDIDSKITQVWAGTGVASHIDGYFPGSSNSPIGAIPTNTNLSFANGAGVFYSLFQDRIRIIDPSGSGVNCVPFNACLNTRMLIPPITGTISAQTINWNGSQMYYTLTNDNTVYAIDVATGNVSIHSGSATSGDVNGALTTARYTGPQALHSRDTSGYMVLDFYNQRIKTVSTTVNNNSCVLKNSSPMSSFGVDGDASKCTYGYINSSYYLPHTGEMYFVESWASIRKMNSDGSVVTFGKPFGSSLLQPIDGITVSNNKQIFISSGTSAYEIIVQ